MPVAADRLLDARRRVLGALNADGGGGDHGGAACLTDGERDAGVGSHVGLLDGDGVRCVLRDELLHPLEDHPQPQLRPLARACRPAPRRECPDPPAAFVDDPVAARSRPWVDAEDLHGRRVRSGADGCAAAPPRAARTAPTARLPRRAAVLRHPGCDVADALATSGGAERPAASRELADLRGVRGLAWLQVRSFSAAA